MRLNPVLYAALVSLSQRLPHLGCVYIGNAGQAGSVRVERQLGGSQVTRVDVWGESYQVNCPFCGDQRRRLSINHLYGTPDPSTNGRFRLKCLWKCYNENCQRVQAYRDQLWKWLFGLRNRDHLPAIEIGTTVPRPPSPAKPPGDLVLLTELPLDHQALTYLHLRGFGADVFSRYGLSYCIEARHEFRAATGRIICPVDFGGERVGWQGRYVGTPSSPGTPKYFSMPGMLKSQLLYNFDRAVNSPVLVVVEGVTDVWRVGDSSVALFGCEASPAQLSLIVEYSRGRRPVIVLLDPDAQQEAQSNVVSLRQRGVPAANVSLPQGLDPGECSSEFVWWTIADQASRAGLPPWCPPAIGGRTQ